MSRIILRALNFILSLCIALFLLAAGAFAAYALWDNEQVYAAAENIQAQMMQYKPSAENGRDSAEQFRLLQEVNPDVCAWITLDGTEIDYPVLQGEDNYSYINTDVYGDFALAGSIFLDASNDPDFGDAYSLLYGHHMDDHRMFGDLDLYREQEFFEANSTGTLYLPDRTRALTILGVMVIPSAEDAVFSPGQWQEDASPLLEFVNSGALFYRQDAAADTTASDLQILAFSTCSTDYTDARTVVFSVMSETESQQDESRIR